MHANLLDGGALWRITFEESLHFAIAGDVPVFDAGNGRIRNGDVKVTRVSEAAVPTTHRLLLTAFSTLDPSGTFTVSLAGVSSRRVRVDTSADLLQSVSQDAGVFAYLVRWERLFVACTSALLTRAK